MKKLLVNLILFLFSNSLFAIDIGNNICKPYESGTVVYDDNGKQLNVQGQSPPAFCWQAHAIVGAINDNGRYIKKIERFSNNQSETFFDFYSSSEMDVYGTKMAGVFLWVKIYGFPQSAPKVRFSSLQGILVREQNISSPSGSILNGKLYQFFIPFKNASSIKNDSDLNLSGDVSIYDSGWNLKKIFRIK